MKSLIRFKHAFQQWWLRRAEAHYLICADVEKKRAHEAQLNVEYYHRQAELARSARG